MKRHYLFLFAIIISHVAASNGQDLNQAGKEFLRSHSLNPEKFTSEFQFSKETNKGNQIILEADDPKCFVIYQKSRNKTQIVAYSTSNNFTPEQDTFLPGADNLIRAIENTSSKNRLKSGFSDKTPIGPLLKTKWDQGKWFNRYCPFEINCSAEENAYVGCVAVAMGQIIKYYGKWNNFILDANHFYKDINLSAYSTGYDWSGMIDAPSNYDLEVCQMLSDIGILIKMNYGYQSSSQGTGWARIGFNELGFENAYKTEAHHFNQDDWLEMIYSSLNNYIPVFVAGNGHAFVCDGYDQEGRLHFNLGWGGIADGYYEATCVLDRYCVNEAIFEVIPANEFEPPHSLRLEEINSEKTISWSPPYQWGTPSSYKVYYSDDNYFTTQDTSLLIDDLIPGTLAIKISAVYPDGESLWIGPIWTFNPGEDIAISDLSLCKAIRNNADVDHPILGNNIIPMGKLANITEIKISDPLSSTSQISEMSNLQALHINGKYMKKDDFYFLDSMNHIQTLKIENINCVELPELNKFKKLVQLNLDSCKIENLNFLAGLDHLLVLEITACEITEFNLPKNLTSLEQLVIKNNSLSTELHFEALSNLRKLEISGSSLSELNPVSTNPRLTSLTLDNNELTNMKFLSKFPNLKSASINNNNIKRLEIHTDHQYLSNLSLSNNEIEDVSISFDIHSLLELNLSNNKFLVFPSIFKHMPNLASLDVSYNSISKLPAMRLPYLRNLNISFNDFNNLKGIDLYEALKTLNVEGNGISDFSPMIKDDMYRNLNLLDLAQNPASKESFYEVFPELEKEVMQLYLPTDYEPRSPCYPKPESNENISNKEINFSWFCENKDDETSYDFYLGVGDSIRLLGKNLRDTQIPVRLKTGQKYYWQVVSNFRDTSFSSGLYEVRTTEEIEIPYHENFELYSIGQGITNSSSNWRLTNGFSDAYEDADITDNQKVNHTGKSLHIGSSSNVIIDLDHIDISTLIIEFDQLVIPGKTAHFCLKNIYGLNADFYSNGYRSQLYINGSPIEEFTVNSNDWNHIRISIQGQNDRISIKCNDQTILNKKWMFKNDKAQIEGIIFSNCPPEQGDSFSSFESYVDNLLIYDANNRTEVDEIELQECNISIFPNPADQFIQITGLTNNHYGAVLEILNSRGQKIEAKQIENFTDKIYLPTSHLAPGVYFYQLKDPNHTLHKGKLLIAR